MTGIVSDVTVLRIPGLILVCGLSAVACAPRMALPEPPPPAPVAGGQPTVVGAGTRVTEEPVRDPVPVVLEEAAGLATYYASMFDGRRTASGIVFSNEEPYAAHRTWPFGTVVRVTNPRNGRSVVLRVVDRGPFGSSERARRTIIDVSQWAARELDFIVAGRIPVLVEVLEWGGGK
jgi:rare lipoprotein A